MWSHWMSRILQLGNRRLVQRNLEVRPSDGSSCNVFDCDRTGDGVVVRFGPADGPADGHLRQSQNIEKLRVSCENVPKVRQHGKGGTGRAGCRIPHRFRAECLMRHAWKRARSEVIDTRQKRIDDCIHGHRRAGFLLNNPVNLDVIVPRRP
jgi:hypothetical protein